PLVDATRLEKTTVSRGAPGQGALECLSFGVPGFLPGGRLRRQALCKSPGVSESAGGKERDSGPVAIPDRLLQRKANDALLEQSEDQFHLWQGRQRQASGVSQRPWLRAAEAARRFAVEYSKPSDQDYHRRIGFAGG